jgi:DNA-binding NarL/FixJ family response regulator
MAARAAGRDSLVMAQTIHPFPIPPAQSLAALAPLRIVVAEGQGLVRAGLRVLLERHDGVEVGADVASADHAVAVTRSIRPHVVLVDLDLPGGGLEATRRVLAASDAVRVVVLLPTERDDAVFAALRAGATGVLMKDADPDQLVASVYAVARGDAMLDPALARRLVEDFVGRPEEIAPDPEALEELTAREREVMALVARGLSNGEIAERLVVTRGTAKTHVSRVLCKLNARDRAQLVVLAYEAGLVRPGGRVSPPVAAVPPPAGVTHIGRRRDGAARRPVLRAVGS